MRIGTTELLLILALAILLFGGSRLAGLGKSLGQGIKEFKSEMKSDDIESVKKSKEDSGEEK
ncbi:MAG: twin-arginine translocase TatA/TatE family subunit [Lachnospiraceae bacterium]